MCFRRERGSRVRGFSARRPHSRMNGVDAGPTAAGVSRLSSKTRLVFVRLNTSLLSGQKVSNQAAIGARICVAPAVMISAFDIRAGGVS